MILVPLRLRNLLNHVHIIFLCFSFYYLDPQVIVEGERDVGKHFFSEQGGKCWDQCHTREDRFSCGLHLKDHGVFEWAGLAVCWVHSKAFPYLIMAPDLSQWSLYWEKIEAQVREAAWPRLKSCKVAELELESRAAGGKSRILPIAPQLSSCEESIYPFCPAFFSPFLPPAPLPPFFLPSKWWVDRVS